MGTEQDFDKAAQSIPPAQSRKIRQTTAQAGSRLEYGITNNNLHQRVLNSEQTKGKGKRSKAKARNMDLLLPYRHTHFPVQRPRQPIPFQRRKNSFQTIACASISSGLRYKRKPNKNTLTTRHPAAHPLYSLAMSCTLTGKVLGGP